VVLFKYVQQNLPALLPLLISITVADFYLNYFRSDKGAPELNVGELGLKSIM